MRSFNTVARPILWAFVAVAFNACSTVMPVQPSGFLRSNDSATQANAARSVTETQHTSTFVSEVQWLAEPATNLSMEERKSLQTALREALLSGIEEMPAAVHGRTIVVRAAIIRVDTVSPLLNTASALLLFVPLDRGGAAVEIEAVDAHTGEQLASATTGYYPPMTRLRARFSKLAPAQIALRKAAADFLPLLMTAQAQHVRAAATRAQ